MPIAGIVILTEPNKADQVLSTLQETPRITTYGIHQENNIIAVLDTDTAAQMKEISTQIQNEIPGITGVYLSNVNYEDLES